MVISNNNGPANLLIRSGAPNRNWIGFSLEGVKSNKDAIGSRVILRTKGLKQTRIVNTAGSYLAANDKRILFGIDQYSIADDVTIQWPSGISDNFKDLESNHYYKIVEGGEVSIIDY